LYGVNVEQNKLAFDWGRFTAHDPDAVDALAAGEAVPPAPASLDDLVAARAAFLVDYQDEAYATRYRERVARVRRLEERMRGEAGALTEAVVRGYFKLLAYKDEYEVARLHTETGFLESLRSNFGDGFKLRFHLSPPLIARMDPDTGRPRKYAFGPWLVPVLRVLARMKRLRGTRLDPFGYSAERRMERRLIADYEAYLDELETTALDDERYGVAVELAALAEEVRGFGPVKARAVRSYDAKRAELLERFRAPAPASAAVGKKRASAA